MGLLGERGGGRVRGGEDGPEGAAVLEVVLLLGAGEAESGVEDVVGADEVGEGWGEGGGGGGGSVHVGLGLVGAWEWTCVRLLWKFGWCVVCEEGIEKEKEGAFEAAIELTVPL